MQPVETRGPGEEGPRRMPIHASLVRPILFAGADRELALANGVVCVALLFGIGVSRYTLAIVVFLVTVGHWGVTRITKADPSFRQVYLRHVRLRSFYPAAGASARSCSDSPPGDPSVRVGAPTPCCVSIEVVRKGSQTSSIRSLWSRKA